MVYFGYIELQIVAEKKREVFGMNDERSVCVCVRATALPVAPAPHRIFTPLTAQLAVDCETTSHVSAAL